MMTEEHWFAWDDPGVFLQSLLYQAHTPIARVFTDRKLRLFAVACSRRVQERCADQRMTTAIDAATTFADATSNADRKQIRPTRRALLTSGWWHTAEGRLAGAVLRRSPLSGAIAASLFAGYLVGGATAQAEQERMAHGPLLRDIVGNPFRSVAFAPEWRTSTAVTLAKGMYESRDFGAMPILADALQDAGCTSDDILNHCRDAHATHVRGCWVVDLVLGKS
jgi:hypothetical protein